MLGKSDTFALGQGRHGGGLVNSGGVGEYSVCVSRLEAIRRMVKRMPAADGIVRGRREKSTCRYQIPAKMSARKASGQKKMPRLAVAVQRYSWCFSSPSFLATCRVCLMTVFLFLFSRSRDTLITLTLCLHTGALYYVGGGHIHILFCTAVALDPSPARAITPAIVQVGGLDHKEEGHWQATYGQTRPDEVGKQVREPVDLVGRAIEYAVRITFNRDCLELVKRLHDNLATPPPRGIASSTLPRGPVRHTLICVPLCAIVAIVFFLGGVEQCSGSYFENGNSPRLLEI